ncbi:hypothetical protein BLA29_014231, partial [Euroglyphus maynei]
MNHSDNNDDDCNEGKNLKVVIVKAGDMKNKNNKNGISFSSSSSSSLPPQPTTSIMMPVDLSPTSNTTATTVIVPKNHQPLRRKSKFSAIMGITQSAS